MATDVKAKLVTDSLAAAIKVREWIIKFTTFQIDQDEFVAGLGAINAKEEIYANWDLFRETKELYPCLEIYQVIASLHEDLDHQLRFYGYDSLKEDLKQIDISINILKRALGMETFGKEKYYQFIKKQINGGI